MEDEVLEVVDPQGRVIGKAMRSEIHGNPSLIHRVVHVLVFDPEGALLLQKRSMLKDVAPGRWDTSVGGHVGPGEDLVEAAMREMEEELGIKARPRYLYSYVHSNPYETELVYTFSCVHDGDVSFNKDEIDEVKAWDIDVILSHMDGDLLSDNFRHELETYFREVLGRTIQSGG